MNHSYEDLAVAHAAPEAQEVLEAINPVAMSRWYNQMDFRLDKLAKKYEQTNPEYAKMIRDYWIQWRLKAQDIKDQNTDAYEYLIGAANTAARLDWPDASFFQGLITTLDSAKTEITSSPTAAGNAAQNEPFMGGAGASTPPLGTDFGPEEEAPPGEESPEAAPGAEAGVAEPTPAAPAAAPGEREPETPTNL